MVRLATTTPHLRRRLVVVAVALAVIGVAAVLASFELGGGPVDVQAAAAVDTLRSYPAYANAAVTSAHSLTSTPARVVVCLKGQRGVVLSRSSGAWQVVARPRGPLRNALAACQ